ADDGAKVPVPANAAGATAPATASKAEGKDDNKDSVAAHLGGFPGILAFLTDHAVPALLADPEIAAFFGHLTEKPADIEECFAHLLDHDLGGESAHFGATTTNGHVCRSSMTEIHRGLEIPDQIVSKFISIIGREAQAAGIAQADIDAVAKVLERY